VLPAGNVTDDTTGAIDEIVRVCIAPNSEGRSTAARGVAR
jgi:hypothetical protein